MLQLLEIEYMNFIVSFDILILGRVWHGFVNLLPEHVVFVTYFLV